MLHSATRLTIHVTGKLASDRIQLDTITRNFDPCDEQQLEKVKQLLLDDDFTCKNELIEFLLVESNKRGYSLFKSLLWIQKD